MNWLKYFYITMVVVLTITIVTFLGLKHQSNITSTQNMQLSLSSINVGEARESVKPSMNKDVLESNLLLKVAESQKKHEHKTVISYVFLDSEDKVTTNEDDIKSVQYKVELLDEKNRVISKSTERVEIHSLLGGGGNG